MAEVKYSPTPDTPSREVLSKPPWAVLAAHVFARSSLQSALSSGPTRLCLDCATSCRMDHSAFCSSRAVSAPYVWVEESAHALDCGADVPTGTSLRGLLVAPPTRNLHAEQQETVQSRNAHPHLTPPTSPHLTHLTSPHHPYTTPPLHHTPAYGVSGTHGSREGVAVQRLWW